MPLSVPKGRWYSISMDFITNLPTTTTGHDPILVICCRLGKRAHFISTQSALSAKTLAQLFLDRHVRYHGIPREIVSDRGSQFISEFWQVLMKELGSAISMSTSHHPQTDGQTERTNQTLEIMLRGFVDYDQQNWESLLPMLEYAYNSHVHPSTTFSPFEFDLGYNPLMPLDLLQQRTDGLPKDVQEFKFRMANMLQQAQDAMKEAQSYQARQVNKHRRLVQYSVGDKVLLSRKWIKSDGWGQQRSAKLGHLMLGPYVIKRVISPNAFELNLPPHLRIHPVVNITRIRPYAENDPEFISRTRGTATATAAD